MPWLRICNPSTLHPEAETYYRDNDYLPSRPMQPFGIEIDEWADSLLSAGQVLVIIAVLIEPTAAGVRARLHGGGSGGTGDLDAVADQLEVSTPALRRRMKKLGGNPCR